jgi:multiple sugar transport system permease protein
VVVVAVTLLIAAHAGYAAARFRFRARSVLLFMILMTSMIPGIAILVPMYLLAVQVGVYNTYFGLALVYTAWQVPTVVWVLKAYFEAIPREIDDAARIDGCSEYRVFWQIVLPLARPGLAAAGLLVFVYVWNDFLIASTLVTSTDLRMVSVGLYNYLSTYGILWGPLMAATIIALLPVVVLFAATQRQFVEGLAAGAVKGAG